MTWSDIRQSGFTLRQANRDKPASSSLVGESEITGKALT
jgi:hypothetical protein